MVLPRFLGRIAGPVLAALVTALLAPAVLSCHPFFAIWSVRGVETPLFLRAGP